MRVILGEAAHDENGQLGWETHSKGDQTGDEVRRHDYYPYIGYNASRPWVYVFRATDRNICNAMAIRMRQTIDNPNCGYGQATRETGSRLLLADPDPSHISVPCDFDCSSLVNTIAKVTWASIGHNINLTGFERTADMPGKYKSLSMMDFFKDVTSTVNLLTGEGLAVGDILVRPSTMGSGHTAMVVDVIPEEKKGTVTAVSLCLRESPINGKVIAYMPLGAEVTIKGEVVASNGVLWYYVQYKSKLGYCSSKYIKA